MHILRDLFVFLTVATAALGATSQGTVCQSACGKYANTLAQCRIMFKDTPQLVGYNYANEFLACLCNGQWKEGTYGNETITSSAGICQSCATTPREIKSDLGQLLLLCAIQRQNGTAGNATIWAPITYKTADDPEIAKTLDQSGASPRAVPAGALFAPVLLATLALAGAAVL